MTILKNNGSMLNAWPMLFNDLITRDLENWSNSNFSETNTSIPAVNIIETAAHYEIEVAALV